MHQLVFSVPLFMYMWLCQNKQVLISLYLRRPAAFLLCNEVRATLNCQVVHVLFSVAEPENQCRSLEKPVCCMRAAGSWTWTRVREHLCGCCLRWRSKFRGWHHPARPRGPLHIFIHLQQRRSLLMDGFHSARCASDLSTLYRKRACVKSWKNSRKWSENRARRWLPSTGH